MALEELDLSFFGLLQTLPQGEFLHIVRSSMDFDLPPGAVLIPSQKVSLAWALV